MTKTKFCILYFFLVIGCVSAQEGMVEERFMKFENASSEMSHGEVKSAEVTSANAKLVEREDVERESLKVVKLKSVTRDDSYVNTPHNPTYKDKLYQIRRLDNELNQNFNSYKQKQRTELLTEVLLMDEKSFKALNKDNQKLLLEYSKEREQVGANFYRWFIEEYNKQQ